MFVMLPLVASASRQTPTDLCTDIYIQSTLNSLAFLGRSSDLNDTARL